MSGQQLDLKWSQRWQHGIPSWRHPDQGGFNRLLYDFAVIDEATARRAVRDMHYSRSFPAARLSFGMYQGDILVGVAVLGVPMRAAVLTRPFPTLPPCTGSIELARFCLSSAVPANGESHMIGQLFAHLRRNTDIRGVLAFADPYPRHINGVLVKPGHWGCCYQSSNCVALGRSTPRTLILLPDGSVLSARSRAKLLAGDQGWRYVRDHLVALGATPPTAVSCPPPEWLAQALIDVGATKFRHGGNFRYAWPLARRVQIGMTPGPYPKPLRDIRIPAAG